MTTIQKITSPETFAVRHPVLRKGKPIESCHFDGDDLASTLHFGLFENESLEGVISLFESKNSLFEAENQIQIRGMAVLEHHQGKGFGRKLITYCEDFLHQKKDLLVWFNARQNAIGFYQKLGYEIIGDSFEIPEVGTHFVMWKRLNR